jgi:hypothetical protein
MKIYPFLVAAFMVFPIPMHADETAPAAEANVLSKPVISRSLADACEVLRIINNLNWKDAKKKLDDGNQVAVIEPLSKWKDWHGIGAFRGTEIDAAKNQVKHRFSYGTGRLAVHEVWITYTYSKDDFKKPSFYVLGW